MLLFCEARQARDPVIGLGHRAKNLAVPVTHRERRGGLRAAINADENC
jgi:hypothetical protein